jgi:hypothetical protein
MAQPDRMTGPDLWVGFVLSAGGTAILSGDQKSLSISREQEVADATAGADGARYNIATIKKFSASIEAHYIGTAGSAIWGSVDIGVSGTLLYGPKGTAANNPKGGIPVIVTKHDISMPFDDVVKLTVEFTGRGAEIFNPHTAKF